MGYRLLLKPTAAFGGYEYEARLRRGSVGIYERAPGASRFRCMANMPRAHWTEWVIQNDHDLDNPARLSRLIPREE